MNKKKFKFLSIFLVLFVGFFIKITGVKAEEIYKCTHFSPFTFIDASERATAIRATINVPWVSDPNYPASGWWDEHIHTSPYLDSSRPKETYIQKFCITIPIEGNTSSAYPNIALGFETTDTVVEDSIITSKGGTPYFNAFSQKTFAIAPFDIKSISPGSSKKQWLNLDMTSDELKTTPYLKVHGDFNNLKLSSATEEEYKKYLEDQYSSLATDSEHYTLFDVINLSFSAVGKKKEYDPSGLHWDIPYYTSAYLVAFGNSDGSLEKFKKYLQDSGGIIFINPELMDNEYPHENYDMFEEILEETDENNKPLYNETQKEKARKGLSIMIDIEKNDYKTGSKTYYEVTKTKWEKYMKDDLENPKLAEPIRKEYFSKWWNLVSRYTFEDGNDMSTFKKYLNYVCQVDQPNTIVAEFDDEYCEILNDVITNMNKYRLAKEKIDNLNDDPCSAICVSCSEKYYNSSACVQECQDEKKQQFNKCTECFGRCKDVPGSTKTDCLKGCMGNYYDDIMQKIKEEKEIAEGDKTDAAKKVGDSVLKLNDLYAAIPNLDIDFDTEPYKANCNDVAFLHTIYMIIIILAPILVIVLGSIDFFKAMLQSDEEKMKKFKKAFPKRVIMLVLLIIVPIIISFLVSIAGLDDSLMRCIIKG